MRRIYVILYMIFILLFFNTPGAKAQSGELIGKITVVSDSFIRFKPPTDFVLNRGMRFIVFGGETPRGLIEVVKIETLGVVARVMDKGAELQVGDEIHFVSNAEKYWKVAEMETAAQKLESDRRYSEAINIYRKLLRIDPGNRTFKNKINALEFRSGRRPSLVINTNPKECSVFLNGKYIGKGPSIKKYQLPPGKYSLRIDPWDKEKFEVLNYDFYLSRNKTTEVKAPLRFKKYVLPSKSELQSKMKRMLTINDIGRLKPEYKRKHNPWPLIATIAGIAIIAGSFEEKGTGKIDPNTGEEKKEKKVNDGLMLLGILVTSGGIGSLGEEPKEIPLRDNIAYNNELKKKLDTENAQRIKFNDRIIREYEQKTQYNLEAERMNKTRKIMENSY